MDWNLTYTKKIRKNNYKKVTQVQKLLVISNHGKHEWPLKSCMQKHFQLSSITVVCVSHIYYVYASEHFSGCQSTT